MNEGSLVSIIINNYNYARFLREAIDSALAQTYQNIEVVVVDDGSTDESQQVIESYGRQIIPVFKNNGGQGSAYNAGFSASRGAAICFLDADDMLFPGAMERAVPTLIRPSGPAKVQWPLCVTGADGRETGELSTKRTPPEGDLREMVMRDGPFYDFKLHAGSLYPRWLLKRVFPVPEPSYRNGADVYVVTLAPIYGEVVNIQEPLGTYRNHGRNNYCGRALDDHFIRDCIRRFEANCDALATYLRLEGIKADQDGWRRRNFNYVWPTRLLQAKQDIERLVPEGAAYILIGGDEWGNGEPVARRHALPFLEAEGAYAGLPADDEQAVCELERLRHSGASVIVIWWTAFWWLEHYQAFARYLQERFDCKLDAAHLLIFDLRESPHAVFLASQGGVAGSEEDEA